MRAFVAPSTFINVDNIPIIVNNRAKVLFILNSIFNLLAKTRNFSEREKKGREGGRNEKKTLFGFQAYYVINININVCKGIYSVRFTCDCNFTLYFIAKKEIILMSYYGVYDIIPITFI